VSGQHVNVHALITVVLLDTWRELLGAEPSTATLAWLRGKLDPESAHEWIPGPDVGQLRRDVGQLLADRYGAPGEDLD
jgi:hypothetical protein